MMGYRERYIISVGWWKMWLAQLCCMWKQPLSRSLKAEWGDAFFEDLRHCKGNLCVALCRNRKFLGGSTIHRELLG